MEAKKATGKYWLYFTIWTAIMAYMLFDNNLRPFFWLALPGVCTHFVKAMDII
jgi:hypothetical protein